MKSIVSIRTHKLKMKCKRVGMVVVVIGSSRREVWLIDGDLIINLLHQVIQANLLITFSNPMNNSAKKTLINNHP